MEKQKVANKTMAGEKASVKEVKNKFTKKLPLEKWELAQYGVTSAHTLLNGWSRIIERIDEYARLAKSREWHKENNVSKLSIKLELAQGLYEDKTLCLLQNSPHMRHPRRMTKEEKELKAIFEAELSLDYDGVSWTKLEAAAESLASIKAPEGEWIDTDQMKIEYAFFPILEPATYQRFVTAESALELEADDEFKELAEKLIKDDNFRSIERMRLREYDERKKVADKLVRFFHVASVRAKSLGYFELARRLIEGYYAAESLAAYCKGGKCEEVDTLFRSLAEDFPELITVIGVDNLPTWNEVVENG